MRRSFSIFTAAAMVSLILSGCGNKTENELLPLLGLSWFMAYDDVKEKMDGYVLLDEREKDDKILQEMQDYANIELFGENCDLTLCFTESGLIGFNYHDINKNNNYREWFGTLEANYGIPTEEGSGMASWYDNPLGKNTAIYLFNLEEGVQVSFYATADSPDKSYEKQNIYIPTPEIRTPIIPVSDEPSDKNDSENGGAAGDKDNNSADKARVPQLRGNRENMSGERDSSPDAWENDSALSTDESGKAVTTMNIRQTTSQKNSTTKSTATTAAAAASNDKNEVKTEPVKENREKEFLLNDLQFYGSPASERKKMSDYTQLYEYRNEVPGQPWELIMEYENLTYLGKKCGGVLCFTSIGLVSVNYFDYNSNNYSYWIDQLTKIYGEPDETQYDYTAWNSSPVGEGTMIYAFDLEDGVQISFFADDTGSELC